MIQTVTAEVQRNTFAVIAERTFSLTNIYDAIRPSCNKRIYHHNLVKLTPLPRIIWAGSRTELSPPVNHSFRGKENRRNRGVFENTRKCKRGGGWLDTHTHRGHTHVRCEGGHGDLKTRGIPFFAPFLFHRQ